MGKIFRQFTWTMRLQLESLLRAKLPVQQIADILGVHNSSIYREMKRGEYDRLDGSTWIYHKAYSPEIAHKKALVNLAAKGAPLKIGKDYKFANYIEKRIGKDKLSPAAVLGEIKYKGMLFETSICTSTLYSYIEKGVFLSISIKDLPFKKEKRSKRHIVSSHVPRGTSIEQRPAEVAARNTFGHWEMDCVCGPTKAALLVLTERLTRKEIIFLLENKKTESVVQCLDTLERRYGNHVRNVVKAITVDNGAEFCDFRGMEKSRKGKQKRVSIYYCHPYCSSERGSNERMNREIRRHLPKGTDFSTFSKDQIQDVEDWVNSYPRGVLGFATSQELFQKHIANF